MKRATTSNHQGLSEQMDDPMSGALTDQSLEVLGMFDYKS